MKISMFGAGYVGVTSAVYFADHGHYVNIVDVNPKKIELLNQGESPIDNEEVKQLVKKNWKENRILATNDSQKAVEESDISLICVGTPTDLKGEVELNSVFSVFRSVGKGLQSKKGYHLIILRSTCPPGTTRQGLEIVQKISGKKAGHNFGGCMCPEFLRGWSLIDDFYNPPFTIVGQFDKKSGDLGELLFQGINSELIRTELEIAEMVKYACNAFHALKASFANEIGRTCKQMGIDAREVMNIFMKDTKLNLSGRYLEPGFAFGGSCLPKDVKALTKLSKKVGGNPVLLESILDSNDMHIEYLVDKIVKLKPKKIGIIGVTYHKDSDDLRHSQIIELIRKLVDKNLQVSIYDNVNLDKLIGANKDYVDALSFKMKDLLVSSMDELVESVDVLIIAHKKPGLEKLIKKMPANKHCIDLGDFYKYKNKLKNYEGICW